MRDFTSTSVNPLSLEDIRRYAPSALAVEAHDSRSSRYSYIPTLEVIKGMENAGFYPFKVTQSRTKDQTRTEFTKHMLRFRQMGQSLAVGQLFTEIVLVNSHDGTSAYKLMAGLWRLQCGNGMCVSDSEIGSVSVMHKGDVVGQVVEASLGIARQSDLLIDTVQRWQGLQLTAGEQMALAQSAHTLRFADSEGKVNTPITAGQLLHIRRQDDSKQDLWHTFNRIQENVTKGGLHARTAPKTIEGHYVPARMVSTKEIKGIDQDVRLNRALWELGKYMEKLKTSN